MLCCREGGVCRGYLRSSLVSSPQQLSTGHSMLSLWGCVCVCGCVCVWGCVGVVVCGGCVCCVCVWWCVCVWLCVCVYMFAWNVLEPGIVLLTMIFLTNHW